MHVDSGRVRDDGDRRLRSALRDVVTRFAGEVRLTARQDVLLCGIEGRDRREVEGVLRGHGVPLAEELPPVRRLAVACPALPTCGQALAEAERVLPEVVATVEAGLAAAGLDGDGGAGARDRLPQRLRPALHGRDRHRRADQDRATTSTSGARPTGERLARRLAVGVKLAALGDELQPVFDRYRAERRARRGLRRLLRPRRPRRADPPEPDRQEPARRRSAHAGPDRSGAGPGVRTPTWPSSPRPSSAWPAEGATPHEVAEAVLRWGVNTFGDRLCLTASMTDAVLLHLTHRVRLAVEVVFVDTGYHFDETWDTVGEVIRRYRPSLRIVSSSLPRDDRWRTDPDGCCAARKVAPLEEVLAHRDAWIAGLRRADGPSRARHALRRP